MKIIITYEGDELFEWLFAEWQPVPSFLFKPFVL